MRPVSTILAVLLFAAWIAIMIFSVDATRLMGAQLAIDVFFGDFAHPWRRQFNLDFVFHLLMFGSWIFWRTRSTPTGIVLFALSAFFGGMFNLMFALVALVLAKGDIRKLLLGARA